jgi:hypothetical protein
MDWVHGLWCAWSIGPWNFIKCAIHLKIYDSDSTKSNHFLWSNLERSSRFRRSSVTLLHLDDALKNRAVGYRGWLLRKLKLKLWWTKMCEVSSYVRWWMEDGGRWWGGSSEAWHQWGCPLRLFRWREVYPRGWCTTGKLLRVLACHERHYTCVAVTMDGELGFRGQVPGNQGSLNTYL